MCSAPNIPKPPPTPPPPPDFADEEVALAQQIAEDERQRVFAGLSSTINTGAQGVLTPGRTSLNPSGG